MTDACKVEHDLSDETFEKIKAIPRRYTLAPQSVEKLSPEAGPVGQEGEKV